MLLQLTLSFGHLHLHELVSQSPHDAPSFATAAATTTNSFLDRTQPADGDEDDCPICIAMHMVAAGALPVAPLAVMPAYFSSVRHSAVARFDIVARRHASF